MYLVARLQQLPATAGIRMPRMHPHMLRHTFVTTMLDAGVSLRDVQMRVRGHNHRHDSSAVQEAGSLVDGGHELLRRHPGHEDLASDRLSDPAGDDQQIVEPGVCLHVVQDFVPVGQQPELLPELAVVRVQKPEDFRG